MPRGAYKPQANFVGNWKSFSRGGFSPAGNSLAAPPVSASYQSYYEATLGVLDGSDAPTVNYGSIKTWRDQTTNALHLTQSTSGKRPKLRTFSPQSVYTDLSIADTYLTNASASINKRAASFFALIDCAQYYSVPGETHTLFELIGGAGTLKYVCPATGTPVIVWVDGGGTHTTTIPVPSSLNLIGVILDSGGLTVYCNDVSASYTALTAGTVTGFNVLGLAAGGEAYGGGANCMVLYSKALSGAEKTTLDTWAIARGAKYLSQSTAIVLAEGDSLSYGTASEDRVGFVKQASIGTNGILYEIAAGGQTWQAIINHFAKEQALYDITKRCVAWINCGVNDLITGVAAATAYSRAQTFISQMRDLGFLVIQNQIATAGLAWLDAGKQTGRATFNASVAAQSTRTYANYQLAVPAVLSDFTDTTYFDADQLHWTHAGHAAMTAQGQAALSALLALPVTTQQGKWDLNGDLTDSTVFTRDWEAVNSPTYTAGLNGKQCLVTANSGAKYARYPYSNTYSLAFYPLTFMFWVKTTSNVFNDNYLRNDSNGIFFCQDSFTGQPHLYFTSAAGSIDCGSNLATNDGVWHAIAFTVDATGAKIYISADSNAANLSLRGSAAWSGTPGAVNASGYPLCIGSNNGTNTINANFQGLRCWAESRTLVQLQAETP